MRALSIRQPWAWLIVHGHKGIENRNWATRYRGPIAIHASKGMTRDEYEEANSLAKSLGVELPELKSLERGGIVGHANIVDCVSESDSDWFFGKYGFVLAAARPVQFQPLKGRLGFFEAPATLD